MLKNVEKEREEMSEERNVINEVQMKLYYPKYMI